MAPRPVSHVARALVALAALAVTASPAFATWSVIAVDQKTRAVVIASATCVPQASFAAFPAKGLMDVHIYFPIQGNILTSDEVVTAAMDAFKDADGTLADRVMAAMETADAMGGDKRCTCESKPLPAATAACQSKTSHVAYILRADPADKPGASFNDGQYAMYVSVTNDDIRPTENANPVKTLRMRYDAWKKAHPQ